ncbi:hypothetical protein RUM44_013846 [Polyplax serrata]|uniref:Ig-like domain-containing protein n=1 Tax=Polyplax serrata TaxID=468196 RepID=A0ABR1BFA5_POLSC
MKLNRPPLLISAALKSVNLILPSVVQAGGSATLFCLYDLDGASLYSVQWYRGRYEFFRFVPKENPAGKAFQIPGLLADTYVSNKHQVTLRDISLHISGEFTCEVTTDAPKFSTSFATSKLIVIDIWVMVPRKIYHFGDLVIANCSTLPANIPSNTITFHWNILPTSDVFIISRRFNSSFLNLNTSIYEAEYPSGTFLQLSCSVWLDNGYHITSKSVRIDVQAKKHFSSGRRVTFVKEHLASFCAVVWYLTTHLS